MWIDKTGMNNGNTAIKGIVIMAHKNNTKFKFLKESKILWMVNQSKKGYIKIINHCFLFS